MTRFDILLKSPSQSIRKQTVDSFVSCYNLLCYFTLLVTSCQQLWQPKYQVNLCELKTFCCILSVKLRAPNLALNSLWIPPPPPLPPSPPTPAPLYIFGIAVLLLLCPYPINLLVRPRKMLMPCFVNETRPNQPEIITYVSNSGSIAVSLRILYTGWIIHQLSFILYNYISPLATQFHGKQNRRLNDYITV